MCKKIFYTFLHFSILCKIKYQKNKIEPIEPIEPIELKLDFSAFTAEVNNFHTVLFTI